MTRLRAVVAFCYGFLLGDDWRISIGIVLALGATYGLSRSGAPAWWLLPASVAALLAWSLRRAVRGS